MRFVYCGLCTTVRARLRFNPYQNFKSEPGTFLSMSPACVSPRPHLSLFSCLAFRILVLMCAFFLIVMTAVPVEAQKQGKGRGRNKDRETDEQFARSRRTQDVLIERDEVEARELGKVWEYFSPDVTRLPVLVVNRLVCMPLQGGRVVALSLENGSLLWETPQGGEFTAPLSAGKSELYIATERQTETGKEGVLRALDTATGLTRWTKTFPHTFRSALIEAGDTLYATMSDGKLHALQRTDGSSKWEFAAQGRFLIDHDQLLLGGDDNTLYALKLETGEQLWKFQGKGKIGKPACDERQVYFGSADGRVRAVLRTTGALIWERRAGASVLAPPLVKGNQLLVPSFDNYLYSLQTKNGSMTWRQLMDGRLIFEPIALGEDIVAIAAFDSNEVTLLEPKSGDVTARLFLNENHILAGIQITGEVLVIPSERGTLAARLLLPEEEKK